MPEGKRGRGQKRGGPHRMACLVASGQAGPPGVARGRASKRGCTVKVHESCKNSVPLVLQNERAYDS
eukprot:10676326-Lingulodinium_polyedra.AAC.1